MSYYYENDPTQVKANLQSTVSYLLSLHKNEAEWNLLGLRVIGHVDALPIPDGNYDYGDVYTIGTEAPYDLWVFTRADAAHQADYWFNLGKFPQPGPQGPPGPGLATIISADTGTAQEVVYDTTTGATITSNATLDYRDKDSSTGYKTQDFELTTKLPMEPGKYVKMDSTSNNNALSIGVDDVALGLDFWKVNKTAVNTAPLWIASLGTQDYAETTSEANGGTFAYRDSGGSIKFHNVYLRNALIDINGGSVSYANQICRTANPTYSEKTIEKTSTNTGTITAALLKEFQTYPQLHIIYDNQLYYRMDPLEAPDGTISFIHIDAVNSGNYKATGKCFSITVSTRAWQVVDLDFTNQSNILYNHLIIISDGVTGNTITATIVSSKSTAYTVDQLITRLGSQLVIGTITIKNGDTSTIYATNMDADTGSKTIRVDYNNTRVQLTPDRITLHDIIRTI